MANTFEMSDEVKEELEALIRQANAGDAAAACRVGDFYRAGIDFTADEEEAIRWYIKATLQGSLMGRNWLDLLLRRNSAYSTAVDPVVPETKELADKGDPAACCIYGMILRAGWGCMTDDSKACDYFRKGASLEHPGCINNLGMMYDSGRGVDEDIQAAVQCYRKAAEMGDGSALNNLAVMYRDGRGVDRDWMLAVSGYRKAISLGMFKAYEPLQNLYFRELSRQKGGLITFEWLEEAAADGDAAAQYCLGCLYQGRVQFPKDFVRSFMYFQRAADQGNVYAQASLAMMYGYGRGTEQDTIQEFNLAKIAARQWVPEAVRTVANRYKYEASKLAYHLFELLPELASGGGRSQEAILLKSGRALLRQKKYGEAIDLFKQMIRKFSCARCDTTDLVHLGVLAEWNTCYGQAIAFQRDGVFLQAWESARESLRIAESRLDRDHVDTAASINLLGEIFMAMQSILPALELFRRALAIRVRRLGRWHPEVAETLYNLAACPSNMAQLGFDERKESRIKLNKLAVSIRVRVYGESHPLVAFNLLQLAECCFESGDFKKAMIYAERSVALHEQALGEGHEKTAYAKSREAFFQEESQAIEELIRREEEDPFDPNTDNYFERYSRRAPQKESTGTDTSNKNELEDQQRCRQALCLIRDRQYPEAFKVLEGLDPAEESNEGGEMGISDPTEIIHVGADEEWNQHYFKAIRLDREQKMAQALKEARISALIALERLGPDHTDFAASLNLLSELYYRMKQLDVALALVRRSLVIRFRNLGLWHSEVAECLHNISCYESTFRPREVSVSHRECSTLALRIRVKVFGRNHPAVALSLVQLGGVYQARYALRPAVKCVRKALAIYEATVGEDHCMTQMPKKSLEYLLEKEACFNSLWEDDSQQ